MEGVMLLMLFLLGAGLMAAVGYGLYRLSRALGYPRLGLGLAGLVVALFAVVAVGLVFEDELFSKGDALSLLREQQLSLQDDFTIVANQKLAGGGDYYHSFTLRISAADRVRLVAAIIQAPGFESLGEGLSDDYMQNDVTRHAGPTVVRNYGSVHAFSRELFQPHGTGYAPTYRVIAVDKTRNEVVFTEVYE